MSLTAAFDVITRPYSGYADPTLPIAAYIAQGVQTGDGSGGFLNLQFLFQLAAARDVSNLYNLEQFAVFSDQGVTIGANLDTVAMDHTGGPTVAFLQRWNLLLTFAGLGLGVAAPLSDQGALPLWLGRPQTGVDAGVQFQFVNSPGDNFTAVIQGFIWGPRSVLADGGPQRPPSGYFRS